MTMVKAGAAELAERDDSVEIPVSAGQTTAIIKGQADAQVETARKYPRSEAASLKKALALATVNPDVAASCQYAKPQGGGAITGPSIRLAEIMAAAWGNLRCEARVVEVTDTEVVAYGMAWDLESNAAFASEVRAPIVKSGGQRYSPSMIAQTGNAACSKALRNAIFRVVPRAAVNAIMDQAVIVGRGDEKTLGQRRDGALAWFKSKGATAAQVFALLSEAHGRRIAGVEDIDLECMETLNGVRQAVADGDTTIAETFKGEAKTAREVVDALPKQDAPPPAPEPAKGIGHADAEPPQGSLINDPPTTVDRGRRRN